MSNITYDINHEFPFHDLSLANPNGIQGGAYFSKIRMKDGEPFIFQTPKCLTKNGIISTDKKIYCDLMITEGNDNFITFLQELEKSVQQLIFEKRNLWFHNNMERDNIEYFFNPIIRTYKKNYLVRTYVKQPKHIKSIKALQIYDENENQLAIKNVTKDKKIIAIIEGLGIKFTTSSFHLELCLRQIMVLENKPLFNKCLIQTDRYNHTIRDISKDTKITMDISQHKEDEGNTSDNNSNENNSPPPSPHIFTKKENTEVYEKNTEEENPIKKTNTEEVNNDISDNTIIPSVKKDLSGNETKTTDSGKKEKKIDPPKPVELEKDESDDNEKNMKIYDIPLEFHKNKEAREKAKAARRLAIEAFLEAKKIKNTFLAGEVEESDDDLDTFKEI